MRSTFPSLTRALVAACCVTVSAAAQSPVPIDFSYAGYEAGGMPPVVASVLTVRPTGGDDTALLQGALDRIASMPVQVSGFRGALLLQPGRYRVKGQILLRASGIVLRGADAGRTVVLAEGIGRRALIEAGATKDPQTSTALTTDKDVPVGARILTLNSVEGLSVGDRVVVRRPSTSEWISAIAMSGLPGTFANQRLDWQPGSHDLIWDRTIEALDAAAKTVTLDAPVTMALEHVYGGGTLAKVTAGAPPMHIGIENLTLESAFAGANPKDEEHAWIAIQLNHVEDAWVRNVTARHFVSSAVRVNWGGRRISIESVRSEAPVSEIGGYRRQAFLVDGQQVLVRHCSSEAGMNDFASGLLAAGPNVFLDDDAKGSLGASGAFEGLASGVLYERVHVPAARLQMVLDFSRAQGAGWTAVNSMIWNSTAQTLDALGPPGAQNYVVDSPQPLYEAQRKARTGKPLEAPLVARVADARGLAEFRPADVKAEPKASAAVHAVEIVNGRFVLDGKAMWGSSQGEAWWRGDTSPLTAARSTGSSVTRFMPGVTAPGETEDLAEMAGRMKTRNAVAIQVNPGLWYDHRRDAHSDERRDDGNVWAPFYEAPWARSGQGVAWDGLSKFDVSRYNPWYFARHREFAQQAAEQGFIVFYDLYNTHNVLEIGPHWVDYAWRPANNVNHTGLPEPPPLKPHNRNDVGNEFFSTANPELRRLHRDYMLHTFDELGDQPNVIFGMAYQYAGPLEFEQFFQDVAHEWETKHGRKLRIALTTSKQTTDAILADPVRSQQIAVVDMRYWEYRPDGSLFAPRAGENHAFRELISKEFPGYSDTPPATTPEQVYRYTREYRDRYPNVALMPMEDGAGPIPILMGGAASQSGLVGGRPPAPPRTSAEQAASGTVSQRAGAAPRAPESGPSPDRVIEGFVQTYLASDLMKMSPQDGWTAAPERTWTLAGGKAEPVLIYSLSGSEVRFARPLPAMDYSAIWFDPRTGAAEPAKKISGAASTELKKPDGKEWLLLLMPE